MDYEGPVEAALSTDLRGEPYNFSLWDIYTGTQLVVFKGNKGNPIPNCLRLIDNNYFITATDNVIHIWSIFNKKCQDQKLFLPSRPTTLCMSPCGNYLVAGISEMIYIWQLHSGNLLTHSQRHYQTVSVLKMSQDGTTLISAGEDGMAFVWSFADLISNTNNSSSLNQDKSKRTAGSNEPKFVWQHHSAQVTDLHLTNGGLCITSSTDMTCNIYSYRTGKRLFCLTMPTPIWSVTMDKNETRIFSGGQDGNIYETAVSSVSLSLMNSSKKNDDASEKPMFVGHKGKVNSLVISMDGTRLVSASIDATCKTWDIYQRKMLLDIKHQAPLANLTTLLVPDALALASMTQSQAKPPLALKGLKRTLYKPPRDSKLMSSDLFEEASVTIVYVKNKIDHWKADQEKLELPKMSGDTNVDAKKVENNELVESKIDKSNGQTVENLKDKLRSLYLLSAEKIFQDAAEESLKSFKPLVDDILVEQRSARKRNATGKPKTKKAKSIASS